MFEAPSECTPVPPAGCASRREGSADRREPCIDKACATRRSAETSATAVCPEHRQRHHLLEFRALCVGSHFVVIPPLPCSGAASLESLGHARCQGAPLYVRTLHSFVPTTRPRPVPSCLRSAPLCPLMGDARMSNRCLERMVVAVSVARCQPIVARCIKRDECF